MTNEAGLSLETDPVLKLTRENDRLRKICFALIDTTYRYAAHINEDLIAVEQIKQELEKQDGND